MCNELFDGPVVNLNEMMAAREYRAFRQMELLKTDPSNSLLSATMNIPGPVKVSAELRAIFSTITDEVEEATRDVIPLANLYLSEKTGLEYYLLVPLPALELKRRMIAIEEQQPFGRLIDLDVLRLKDGHLEILGRKDLDLPRRKCFICERDAKECGRTRRHSVEEMQAKIIEIVKKGKEHRNA